VGCAARCARMQDVTQEQKPTERRQGERFKLRLGRLLARNISLSKCPEETPSLRLFFNLLGDEADA